MRAAPFLLLAVLAAPARPATKLLVTVIEQKSGKPVTGLKAADFTVLDDRTPRSVEAVEFSAGLMDVMLLLDTSLVGGAVQPLAVNLIDQLQPKEQMAIVSFDSSADLIQDFTSSRELLRRAVAGVKYGNSPCLLDALYAAIDGGFQGSSFRRVVLLLTTGIEGPSRVSEREVVRRDAAAERAEPGRVADAGERMVIRDEEEAIVLFLHPDVLPDRSEIVAQVQFA